MNIPANNPIPCGNPNCCYSTCVAARRLASDKAFADMETTELQSQCYMLRKALARVSDFLEANYTTADMPDILPMVRAALAKAGV